MGKRPGRWASALGRWASVPSRWRRPAAPGVTLARLIEGAAREMQLIVLTCHPERFARIVGAVQFTVALR